MEDAGRLRFTCTWEGRRKTGRDMMGLKEWEQESQGEKGSAGLGNESRGSQRRLLNIPPCEVISSGYRVESNFTEPIALTHNKCSKAVTDCRLFSKLLSSQKDRHQI